MTEQSDEYAFRIHKDSDGLYSTAYYNKSTKLMYSKGYRSKQSAMTVIARAKEHLPLIDLGYAFRQRGFHLRLLPAVAMRGKFTFVLFAQNGNWLLRSTQSSGDKNYLLKALTTISNTVLSAPVYDASKE